MFIQSAVATKSTLRCLTSTVISCAMITRITTTSERSFCVGTSSMFIAAMGAQAALVHVYGDKNKTYGHISDENVFYNVSHLIESSVDFVELSQWNTSSFFLFCLTLSFCFNRAPVKPAEWCISEESLKRIASLNFFLVHKTLPVKSDDNLSL